MSAQHGSGISLADTDPSINLNWYDFVDKEEKDYSIKYDTVLASDCAYHYPDVLALSSTMASVCLKEEQSRIHVYGPYNRGAQLIIQLRDELDMNVVVDWLEMSHYRFKPHRGLQHSNFPDVANIYGYCASEENCLFASRKTAKFLHIMTWHKTPADKRT